MSAFSRLRGLIVLIILFSPIVAQAAPLDSPDYRSFEKIFNDWTNTYNHKEINKVCSIYSKHAFTDRQGELRKNYQELCQFLENQLKDKDKSYQYQFTLHDVYRSGELACARITWYLRIFSKNEKLIAAKQDEDVIIFKQDSKSQWRIVNTIGYPTIKE